MSEGLDFSDRAGRAVIITGIPYAMKTDPKARPHCWPYCCFPCMRISGMPNFDDGNIDDNNNSGIDRVMRSRTS